MPKTILASTFVEQFKERVTFPHAQERYDVIKGIISQISPQNTVRMTSLNRSGSNDHYLGKAFDMAWSNGVLWGDLRRLCIIIEAAFELETLIIKHKAVRDLFFDPTCVNHWLGLNSVHFGVEETHVHVTYIKSSRDLGVHTSLNLSSYNQGPVSLQQNLRV